MHVCFGLKIGYTISILLMFRSHSTTFCIRDAKDTFILAGANIARNTMCPVLVLLSDALNQRHSGTDALVAAHRQQARES